MLISVVIEIIKLKSKEKTDLIVGQLMAYEKVLILSGLTEDEVKEIMKGNQNESKI
jgi:hypothetical protein